MSIALDIPPYGDCNHLCWQPGRGMARHGHDYLQCIHVLEGELQVDWGEGWRAVGPGQVHVLPPGCRHALQSPRGQRQFGLNCHRDPDERGLLALALGQFIEPCVLDAPAPAWITGLGEASVIDALARLDLVARLDAYLLDLVARQRGAGDVAGRLLACLRDRLDSRRPIEEATDALGLGRATLQRHCRRRFGCGIAHLHERLRMERVAQRMVADRLTLAAAAELGGYGEVYAFSRAFRRVMGMPPGRWRDEQRARLA